MDLYDLTRDDIDRFWSMVDRADMDDCWEWQGTRNYGYGVLSLKGRTVRAHRFSVGLTYREWPALSVLHHCDNPPCVNPAHLFFGNNRANNLDRDLKGRGNPPRGERAGNARLTEADVRAIRNDLRPLSAIAADYDVHPITIHDIRNFRTWAHVDGPAGWLERPAPVEWSAEAGPQDYAQAAEIVANIGAHISGALKARGIMLRTLSEETGIGASDLSRFVHGHKHPSIPTAVKLLRWLSAPHPTTAPRSVP